SSSLHTPFDAAESAAVSGRRLYLTQVVNRSPTAGSDESCRSFTWPRAHGIIRHFFSSPKNVTHAESARDLAPISSSSHQITKLILGCGIILKALRPKMAGITHHDLATLEQERMIVSRVSGKARFDRQTSDGCPDRIEFSAIDQCESGASGGQTAKQTNESGAEERNAKSDPHWRGPLPDQIAP